MVNIGTPWNEDANTYDFLQMLDWMDIARAGDRRGAWRPTGIPSHITKHWEIDNETWGWASKLYCGGKAAAPAMRKADPSVSWPCAAVEGSIFDGIGG